MTFIRLIPVFFSFMLIAAHFQRAGLSLIAILCLLPIGLLYFTRPWAIRILQLLLFLAALEWGRTLFHLIQMRIDTGLPWTRLAIILGVVILFTMGSALIFQHKQIKRKYGIIKRDR